MVINIPDAKNDLESALSASPASTTSPYASTVDPLEIARQNWGEYVINRTHLFDTYWLQFPPPDNSVLYGLGIFVAAVGILSVVGNGIVCYTFLRSPSLRNQKLFTVNLALSDLIGPLFTYHMFVVSCFQGIWIYSKQSCNYYALIQGYCGLISITSLAAIALERYGAIAAPNSFWMKMSYAKKSLVIFVLWIYCFMIVSPPLYGFGNYVAAGFLVTCCFDYIERDWGTRSFILYLFSLGLLIPTMIIIYSYVQIYRSQKEGERELQRRLDQTLLEEENPGTSQPDGGGEKSKRFIPKGKEKRLAKLMLIVIMVFVLAWTPYAVVALLGQFGPRGAVKPWMAMVPSVLAKSSTLYNPFLYAFKDSRFQRAMRKYIFRKQLPLGEVTDSMTTKTEAAVRRIARQAESEESDICEADTPATCV